jgi:hypothetical protein
VILFFNVEGVAAMIQFHLRNMVTSFFRLDASHLSV